MTSTLPNDNIKKTFGEQISNKLISEIIRDRIKLNKKRFHANDNISDFINPGELEILQREVAEKVKDLLKSLVIDIDNDHNSQETAQRVAKMYLQEVFKGRYHKRPNVTDFPNAKKLDEIYTLGPISVRSACSHHMVPIIGIAHIAYIPVKKVVGISKLARTVEIFARRLQTQETMTQQIATSIYNAMKPKGVAVFIKAIHQCMTTRGVEKPNVSTITNTFLGDFKTNNDLQRQFLNYISNS